MNFNRIKNMLAAPKNEWTAIDSEQTPSTKLLGSYLLLIALIPTVCSFIGYGLVGYKVMGIHFGGSIGWGIRQAVVSFIAMIGGAYLTAFVVNALAENFGSVKNFDKAFALVVYSYTPLCVAGMFYILPSLAPIVMLAGLYGLYILYTGLAPMMKTPAEKVTTYFIVSLLCMVAVSVILSLVLRAVLLSRGVMM